MDNQFPFPKGWFTAGHGELWDCNSTYCFVPYENLPPLDTKNFNGSFQWLVELADEFEETLSPEEQRDLTNTLDNLAAITKQQNLNLPDSFVRFIATSHLRNRIESCTDCYFDLSNRLIKIPDGNDGYLIRFLNDSQNVLLWYLYINGTNENCITVAKPQFLDELEENFSYANEAGNEKIDDVIVPKNIYYCAPDFETFIYRFWIENSIWFTLTGENTLTKEQQEYMNERRQIK